MPTFTFQTRRPLPETAQEMQARIKYLFTIRDELDKELEMLMGRRDTFEAARPWHCVRCSYEWRSRLPHRPKLCPKCKAKKFDTPPLYTYEERMARKAANGKLPLVARAANPINPMDLTSDMADKSGVLRAPLAHSVITRQVSTENDSIQNVMLTPPPAPGTIHPVPMSLRERLAMLKSQPTTEGESDTPRIFAQSVDSTPLDSHMSARDYRNGAAADGAHLESNESAEALAVESAVATEEELMDIINGESNEIS